MIRLIESLPPKKATCAAEIRIYSLFSAYGDSDLAYFWEQSSDKVTALISKMDGAITLCAYEGADIDEILQFISVVGADSVLSNIRLPMDKGERLCQLTLTAKSHGIKDIPTPDYQKTYDIMSTRFDMPSYDVWYPDMCHRVRHGAACLVGEGDGQYVPGRDALFHQVRHAIGEHAGLAAARARQQQQRPLRGQGGSALHGM